MTKFVTVDSRLQLERVLLDRWKAKHADEVLRRLERWVGWRWCTEQELLETVGHVAKPIRARRIRDARDELPAMLALLPLTPAADVSLLRQRIAFALAPPADLVIPEDRELSPWHCLAICSRGLPMTRAISQAIGGQHLVPFADLERQLQEREDEKAVRLLKLEQEAARDRCPSSRTASGPSVVGITF